MPQQELSQTISCPQLVSLGRFAGSYQIAQGLVSGIRHPYRGQLSRSITPGQLQRIAPVGLHAISGSHRYQCWRYYFALGAQRRQLPVQYVARRTGPVTEMRFFNRTLFLDQFTNGLKSIRYYFNRSHLSVLLRNGEGNRLGVDIQTNKFYSFYGPAPFAVALRFGLTASQRNPRAANRSRSFLSFSRLAHSPNPPYTDLPQLLSARFSRVCLGPENQHQSAIS
jgi:hypothetical protein